MRDSLLGIPRRYNELNLKKSVIAGLALCHPSLRRPLKESTCELVVKVLRDYIKTMTLMVKTEPPTQHAHTDKHTQTHTYKDTNITTSETAVCPHSAPEGHLEHTGRPQSRHWSRPSGTVDFSVKLTEFSSLFISLI